MYYNVQLHKIIIPHHQKKYPCSLMLLIPILIMAPSQVAARNAKRTISQILRSEQSSIAVGLQWQAVSDVCSEIQSSQTTIQFTTSFPGGTRGDQERTLGTRLFNPIILAKCYLILIFQICLKNLGQKAFNLMLCLSVQFNHDYIFIKSNL